MKLYAILALAVAVFVLIIGGILIPSRTTSLSEGRLKKIEEREKLATDLSEMQADAKALLRRAQKLTRSLIERRREVSVGLTDPFAYAKRLEHEEVSETQPPPSETIEETPTEDEAEPLEPPSDLYDFHKPDELPELELTGVVLAGRNSMAIINGEVYSIGDVVEGFRLVKITPTEAVLVSPLGERRILVLKEQKGESK